jgi:DNA-binding transcriptional regulator YhcF (GntR family)
MKFEISEGLTQPLILSKVKSLGNSIRNQIVDELKKRIITGQISEGIKIPSTKIFAKMHGVSIMTMHQSLKKLSKQGYLKRIPSKGSFVCMPNQKSALGVIFGSDPFEMNSTFWRFFLNALRDSAFDSNLSLYFHYNLQGEFFERGIQRIKEEVSKKHYRGLLVFAASGELNRWCKTQTIVNVLIPNIIETVHNKNKILDQWSVQAGVSYLLKRGFKRIMVVSRVIKDTPVKWYKDLEREEIVTAFEKYHYKMPPGTIHYWGSNAIMAYQKTIEIFSKPKSEWPDAIYSNHDLITPSILTALSELRLQIPLDVALMTHSNKGNVFPGSTSLTRMESEPILLAQEIIKNVLSPMTPLELNTFEIKVSLPHKIVEGKSCGE